MEIAFDQRQRRPDRIPKMSRQDIIDAVRHVWLQLDHKAIASVGYRQTGPTLPLLAEDGGLSPDIEAVFKDLRPFVQKLNLQTLCQAAFDEVTALWEEGIVTSWADASTIVEQHTGHKCMVEGTEGLRWQVEEDDGVGPEGAGDGGVAPEGAAGAGVAAEASDGEDAPRDADDVAGADDGKVAPHIVRT